MGKGLTGLDLSVPVAVPVGGDPVGGDGGQCGGVDLGAQPGRQGGSDAGDRGAAGGGEGQFPGLHRPPGPGALRVRGTLCGGGAGQGVDQGGGGDPGGVFLPDQGRGLRAEHGSGSGSGAVEGRFRFSEGGFGAVPPPPVGPDG